MMYRQRCVRRCLSAPAAELQEGYDSSDALTSAGGSETSRSFTVKQRGEVIQSEGFTIYMIFKTRQMIQR